jgi:ABC-type branched-subunit amino acid transport system ATPase component
MGVGLNSSPASACGNDRGRLLASQSARQDIVATLGNVTQLYGKVAALDDVSPSILSRRLVGLIGPDGVGKSALLSLIAGARQIQSAAVRVFGGRAVPPAIADTAQDRFHSATRWAHEEQERLDRQAYRVAFFMQLPCEIGEVRRQVPGFR